MRNLLLLSFWLLLSPAISNAASPIQNIIDVPFPIRSDGGPYSIEEVRAAMIKGSQTPLWTGEVVGERTIRAKLNVRDKHFAIVEIQFSESTYSIIYVSSENLDYNPARQTIHRNYRNWVLQLSTMINRQFIWLESKTVASEINTDRTDANKDGDSELRAKSEEKVDLYKELLKLDDLRQRGILTDEEFQSEKKRLLDKN